MTTNAKFEKWLSQSSFLGGGNLDVLVTRPLTEKAWQDALSSLEVTPELVELFETALYEHPGFDIGSNGYLTREAVKDTLRAVFAAIKEGKA